MVSACTGRSLDVDVRMVVELSRRQQVQGVWYD